MKHHVVTFHTEQAQAAVKRAKAHHRLADLHADNPEIVAEHRTIAECETACADSHLRARKAENSNANDIDNLIVDVETRRGDVDSHKLQDEPFGTAAGLHKSPAPFGMAAARRDLDKVVPTEVRGVIPSAPNLLVGRPGGKPILVEEAEDSTAFIDSILK
jgi:hypothetical protein